jgi:hypothetical protein
MPGKAIQDLDEANWNEVGKVGLNKPALLIAKEKFGDQD